MKIGKELKEIFTLSNWTDKSFVQKSIESITPSSYRGNWFIGNGRVEQYFTWENNNSSLKAYCKCPPVTAIINKKAQAFVNGKMWLLNNQGKAKDKEATSDEAMKIKALLARPNPLQSWKQFEAQNYIYQQLAGFAVVLPIKPVGFKELYDAKYLWNIPPQMLDIKEKTFKPLIIEKVSDLVESVHLCAGTERIALNVDDLIIIKDFTPSFESLVFPESRLKPLEMPVNNIVGAYESRNVLINNRGPQYLISSAKTDESGSISLLPGEKEQIQKDFERYGIRKGQWKQIITNANIKVEAIGFPTKDLMLFEEIEGSTMAICDNYGYPYRLLAAEKSASYNDVSEFKKMLYQDTTIPESESWIEQWDTAFNTAELNIRFDKDFSHVAVLQEDESKKASARKLRNEALQIEWRNGKLTLNQWCVMNGDDPLPDERGKMYFPEYVAIYGDSMKPVAPANEDQNGQDNTGQAGSGKAKN